MNYVSSVAERAMVSVDYLLDRAMTYAWTSTLQRRCPGGELPSGLRPPHDDAENHAGEVRSPQA
jgi:hypothetical protein